MSTTGTDTPIMHLGPIIVEVGACIECVQSVREALARAAELCKAQWRYDNPKLAYLIEQALERAEGYLLTTGKLISEATPEDLQAVLTRLHEKFDAISGRRLAKWYAENLKDLLTMQLSLVTELNRQLQDAFSQPEPDAEICLAIMSALEREHVRQASAANLWGVALSYTEQADRHYATAQKLATMHVEKPA